RGNLRQVHVAAAAQTEQGIGRELPSCRNAGICSSKRRLRLSARKHFYQHTGFAQRHMDLLDDACLNEDSIGHDEDAFGPQPTRDFAELPGGVLTEEKLAGRMKGPSGAHENLQV